MMDPITVYAAAASGLFTIFILSVALTIWSRRRSFRVQQANANSLPQVTLAYAPAAVNPSGTTPVPENVYPHRPGGGNIESPSNSTPTSGGDTTSASPLPSSRQKHQEPPPAYMEV